MVLNLKNRLVNRHGFDANFNSFPTLIYNSIIRLMKDTIIGSNWHGIPTHKVCLVWIPMNESGYKGSIPLYVAWCEGGGHSPNQYIIIVEDLKALVLAPFILKVLIISSFKLEVCRRLQGRWQVEVGHDLSIRYVAVSWALSTPKKESLLLDHIVPTASLTIEPIMVNIFEVMC